MNELQKSEVASEFDAVNQKYTKPELGIAESLVIKSSVRKLIWLVLLVGALTAIAVVSIPRTPVIGWIATIFLAPCFMLSLYLYRPGATYLRLDQEGIEIRNMGRRFKVEWADIAGFHIGEVRGDKMIGILYSETYLDQQSTLGIYQSDADQAWIRDLYTLPIEATCDILNQWKMAHNTPFVQRSLIRVDGTNRE